MGKRSAIERKEMLEQVRKEQEKSQKKARIILTAVLSVAILALAGIIAFIFIEGKEAPLQTSSEQLVPETPNDEGGILLGASETPGDGNAGKPVVSVYYDYLCPVCKVFEETNSADLTELRNNGEITLAHHPISILDRLASGTQYSTRSAVASLIVLEQSPEHYLAFHDALFDNQPGENSSFNADKLLKDVAEEVGIDKSVYDQFPEGVYVDWVNEQTQAALSRGVQGTPTVLVDGKPLPDDVKWQEPGSLRAYLESLSE